MPESDRPFGGMSDGLQFLSELSNLESGDNEEDIECLNTPDHLKSRCNLAKTKGVKLKLKRRLEKGMVLHAFQKSFVLERMMATVIRVRIQQQ
jgi:phage terminase Nu1 subunit (DNA packaging protein)